MTLQDAFDRYLPLIENELREIVPAARREDAPFYDMIRYHMGWLDESLQEADLTGGKRIRPVLCLLCCEAAGGDPRAALPAAAAVELIHNFSLVHDDIQDGSRFRRGRRAVWDVWGVTHGINVGDALFVLARLALHRLAERGVAAEQREGAMEALDRACLALCDGQFLDMTFEERNDIDVEQYLSMIRRKTAALLAAAAQLGAIVATRDRAVVEQFRRFGEDLGMAFQIQDDILGAWGDARVTGKSATNDLRAKKKTLPVVLALSDGAHPAAQEQLRALLAGEGELGEEEISGAREVLEAVGARVRCEAMAEDYYRRAVECLEATGHAGAARSALVELTTSLLGRVA